MISYVVVALIAFHVGFLAAAILASARRSDHITELHADNMSASVENEELVEAFQG